MNPPTVALRFSETGWAGLEKPVGQITTENWAGCVEKCSQLGPDCDLLHYHWGLRLCTPAKVRSSLIGPDPSTYCALIGGALPR